MTRSARAGRAPAHDAGHRRLQSGTALHKAGGAVVVLLLAVALAVQVGWLPRLSDDTPPVLAAPPVSGPGLELTQPAPAAAVLDPATVRHPISVGALQRRLSPVVSSKAFGPHLGFAVARLGEPGLLWQTGDPALVTPASTLKLLTTTAALATMGPEHRFTTSVVRGKRARDVILVGGGSPLLTTRTPKPAEAGDVYPAPASLQSLAAQTADRLRADHVRRVRLSFDDSLFTGPAVNPRWEPSYIPDSVVSPITALWVDEGRAAPGYALRVDQPAVFAAQQFAGELERAGIKVTGPVRRTQAAADAQRLAEVASPPLSQIVQHVLELSDNEGAEVLLRQVAIATGRPGSSAAGVRAMTSTLTRLGIDMSQARLYDGSGLSRDDLLPIETLVDVLQLAASPQHPELRSVVSSLPVAGFTGSLDYRFLGHAEKGLGVVRAKTGTLTGVHGLAGLVMTRDGQPLLWAAVADRVPVQKTLDARADLDRIGEALARCGC